MKILFLTIGNVDMSVHGIYADLLKEFYKQGHDVYVVHSTERRNKEKTKVGIVQGIEFLQVSIGNITKCGMIEKGISTVLVGSQFKKAIKKFYSNIKFDLILYSTPPITFESVIGFLKRRDGAKSYLMLKDIFPQNSIDLGIISDGGIGKLIYSYFRSKEKRLYKASDKIGCMSPANCEYVILHNNFIEPDRVEVCPNSIEPQDMSVSCGEKDNLRKKYGLPLNKKIFVYGGNLGKPQDVPFLVSCLKECSGIEDVFFVIAGSGTERHILEEYVANDNPHNLKLFSQMEKSEYDSMIACCDVGLIFLDHRFTIPNFPSRLLSYMQAKLPVLCCTDNNTDVGSIVSNNGFGWSCQSDDPAKFRGTVIKVLDEINPEQGIKAYKYLIDNYSIENTCKRILYSSFGKEF